MCSSSGCAADFNGFHWSMCFLNAVRALGALALSLGAAGGGVGPDRDTLTRATLYDMKPSRPMSSCHTCSRARGRKPSGAALPTKPAPAVLCTIEMAPNAMAARKPSLTAGLARALRATLEDVPPGRVAVLAAGAALAGAGLAGPSFTSSTSLSSSSLTTAPLEVPTPADITMLSTPCCSSHWYAMPAIPPRAKGRAASMPAPMPATAVPLMVSSVVVDSSLCFMLSYSLMLMVWMADAASLVSTTAWSPVPYTTEPGGTGVRNTAPAPGWLPRVRPHTNLSM
mmetsp:Transcript_37323/g.94125  ORF Transcript_37323/g.94125 Transcript_37323/m.94125 type:complete len:283 (+) Transcript_37323:494-1342(+)